MTLFGKLCIYIVSACLGIFIAIAIFVEYYAVNSESEQAEHVTQLLQTELVSNLDTRLYAVEQNVRRTVKQLSPYDVSYVKANAIPILKILMESDSIIKGCSVAIIPGDKEVRREWMEYLYRDGSEIKESQLGGNGYNYVSKQWYMAPLEAQEPKWSEPYIDDGGGDCLMLTYAYPVTDSLGNYAYEVTADIAISMLDEELNHLIPYKGSYSFTLTKDGKLLDGYPNDLYKNVDRSTQPDFTEIASTLESGKTLVVQGKEFICTYTPVQNINLVICTASPFPSVTSITSKLRIPLLVILLVGFIVLLIILRLTLKRAMRPLNGLMEASIEVGKGKFDTIFPPVTEYSDISKLRDAIVFMRDSINRYMLEIEESTRAREKISSQLRIAREIQRSLLPPENTIAYSGDYKVILSAAQESAMEVGGDLYDYVQISDRFYFIIADVSGKGVPAAMMTSYIKSLFRFAAQQNMNPFAIAECINENMCADNKCNMFATLQVGYIDLGRKKLFLTNAGHNPAIFVSDGDCVYLSLPPGLPVGVISGTFYTQEEFNFTDGDIIYIYTDGVSEAQNKGGELYGQERLLKLGNDLIKDHHEPKYIVSKVMAEIENYSVGVYTDDITMLCMMAKDDKCRCMGFRYDIAEIEKVFTFIQCFASDMGLSKEVKDKMMLVVEEWFSNIIYHSKEPYPGAIIDISLTKHDKDVEMTITDCGQLFNPLLQGPNVDPSLPLEERGIGGLGIFLIRQISEMVKYERKNNKNKLIIKIKNDSTLDSSQNLI